MNIWHLHSGRTPFHRIATSVFPRLAAISACIAFTASSRAQIEPGTPANNESAKPAPPAAAAPATTPDNDGKVIELSVFEVRRDRDNSYGALNSNSITRFSTEMEKIPVSADIFTESFMRDVGASSVEQMMAFSAGAGYAAGADPSASAVNNQPGDRNGNAYTQLRGFNTPAMSRDGFMPVGAFGNPGSTGVGMTSNFDLERTEVIFGPQSLLYGNGGPGGVINAVSKQARFNAKPYGEFSLALDQFGGKRGEFDFGMGNDIVAARIATLKEEVSNRRVNIGGRINGLYGMLAFKLPLRSTLKLVVQQTTFDRVLASNISYTGARDTTNGNFVDPRNNMRLHYLLATGRTGPLAVQNPKTGVTTVFPALLDGNLNWGNVDSFGGWQYSELVINDYMTATLETQITKNITSQLVVGYDDYRDDRDNPGVSFYGPGTGNNSVSGWRDDGRGFAASVLPVTAWQPARTKGIRYSVTMNNEFLGGNASSQTVAGIDYIRVDMRQNDYTFYQADENWNILGGLNLANDVATDTRTPISRIAWSIDDGVVRKPVFNPRSRRITYNGQNYVRAEMNPQFPDLVGPGNPLGTVLNNANQIYTRIFNRGGYVANFSHWFNGKLDTMAGIRYGNTRSDRIQFRGPRTRYLSNITQPSFNLGFTYNINDSWHAYASTSDSYSPPFLANAADPHGEPPKTSHGQGVETGIKFNTPKRDISGTLSYYLVQAKNDLYAINSALSLGISPDGLNGRPGNNYINIDRKSQGLTLAVTASPAKNWRIRLNAAWVDGRTGKDVSYDVLYNDQFHTDGSGHVMYSDGTPVYVRANGTGWNSSSPVINPTDPNAVPLTIAMLSTPGNFYYVNPNVVSGAIDKSTPGGTVMTVTGGRALNHGQISTGVNSLPISEWQLDPHLVGFSPVQALGVARASDKTVGYPEYSMNLTSMYDFDRGILKGFSAGGIMTLGWRNRGFYYFPEGVRTATLKREMFYQPTLAQFNLILGYKIRFRHVTFTTRLNINNIFNQYHITITPSAATGWTDETALNATFYQQPRTYLWTNTISF